MSDASMSEHFREQRATYFDPLCQSCGLEIGLADIGEGFARVSAAAGNVRVFFEDERGLCWFGIGAFGDAKPLCSVEGIAERFPRIRVIPLGTQRLTLEEQRSFLEGRWPELQVMFSPEHILETRRWHKAQVAAYMKRFTRRP